MNTILIIGIVQAIFLTLLVFNKKNKGQPDYVLIGLLTYTALHQLFFLANFNEQIHVPLPMMIIGAGFPLLYGPVLYFYVLSLIRKDPVPPKIFLLHLLPYLLFELTLFTHHYALSDAKVLVYDGFLHLQGDFPLIIWNFGNIFAISGAVYPIISLVLLRLHKGNIHRQFSYEEEINLNWLGVLILFTLISFLISYFSILFIVDWNWNNNPRVAFYVVSTINTVFIFFIGYFGLKQTSIFSPQNFQELKSRQEEPRPVDRYVKSGLDNKRSSQLLEELDELMITNRLHLEPKLALNDLADRLGVSTNHLSQAINENRRINFFDYVNSYRVEEFKSRIDRSDFDHLTLLGVAMDCGFNSKSSFNQIFKNQTGMTPSTYKRSLLQANSVN